MVGFVVVTMPLGLAFIRFLACWRALLVSGKFNSQQFLLFSFRTTLRDPFEVEVRATVPPPTTLYSLFWGLLLFLVNFYF